MKTGVELIADERKRQIEVEGWTSKHDDQHCDDTLVVAGICYAAHVANSLRGATPDKLPPQWPWEARWWKPEDNVRTLVKAGALIAAQIDRLQRRADYLSGGRAAV